MKHYYVNPKSKRFCGSYAIVIDNDRIYILEEDCKISNTYTENIKESIEKDLKMGLLVEADGINNSFIYDKSDIPI
jgi:hypothetical protein